MMWADVALALAIVLALLGTLAIILSVLRRHPIKLPNHSNHANGIQIVHQHPLDFRNRVVVIRWKDQDYLALINPQGGGTLIPVTSTPSEKPVS